jgi:hypothetical protein
MTPVPVRPVAMTEPLEGQERAGMRDRYGFLRLYGIEVFRDLHLPGMSLGLHLDWHTPLLDLHVGRSIIQIGRIVYEGKRFCVHTHDAKGHTVGCRCSGV